MLCKRLGPRALQRRLYSSQNVPTYPFQNLRAFPFNLSPYDAQRYLSPYASIIRRGSFFQSIISRILPILGVSPIKPVRFTPVYFPGWILDVEVEGKVMLKGEECDSTVQIHNAYIPGSDYKVLSSVPLVPSDPTTEKTIPFSEDLLKQHDLDVACIPFNISPFSICDIASHLSHSEASISESFRFLPSTLKPTLFAAYPVLLPLYLAQYEYETDSGNRLHTLFIEAFDKEGNIWSEAFLETHNTEHKIVNQVRSFLNLPDMGTNPLVHNLGYPKKFVEAVGVANTPHQELGHALRDYLEKAMNLSSTPTTLAAASVNEIDKLVDDPRVREFTPDDRTPIIKWLMLGSELMMLQRIHQAMTKVQTGRSTDNIIIKGKVSKNDKSTILDGTVKKIVDRVKELETQRRQIKPEWAKTEEDILAGIEDVTEEVKPEVETTSDSEAKPEPVDTENKETKSGSKTS